MSGIPNWVEQAQHAALVSPDRSPRDQDARPRHASRHRSSQQRHRENTSTPRPPSRPPSRPSSRPSSSSPRPPPRPFRQYSRGQPSPFASFGPPSQPVFISREWKWARTAAIRVKDVPPGAKLQDLHDLFSEHGHISYLEIDEDRPDISDRGRRALVRFEPPPLSTDFLCRGVCRLRIGLVDHWLPLETVDPKREDRKERTIKTQLGNTCPQTLYVFPSTLSFGVLVQPAVFMRKQSVQTLSSDSLLRLEFDFKRMRLVIKFSLHYQRESSGFRRQNEHYKLHIKFGVIKELCRTMVGEEHRQALIMTLRDPPVAYRKKDVSKTFGEDRLTWSENDLWERVVDIRPGLDVSRNPVSLAENHQYIDLGRWLAYWIELDQQSTRVWDQVQQHLVDWNLRTKLTVFPEPLPNQKPKVWDLLDDRYGHFIQRVPSHSWNSDFSLLAAPPRISLPFDVRYQLEVCISQGIINEHNIDREFLEKLKEFCDNDNSLGKDRARLILEYAADEYAGKRIFNPMELFKDNAALTYFPSTFMVPNHCAWVRRVTITPTRIYFSTPCVEPTNRVIRQWKYAQDYFIRIQFTDEVLEGRIKSGEAELPLFLRAYRVLQEGVAMGPWHWKFLAFGNSQIREAGAFMFCEQSDLTCDMMRAWMGRFSHIKVIAKYAARLGQCFSTTRLVPGIPAPKIVTIPDVEKDGFCFTDGVGKISPLLAKIVAHDWSIDPPPSAYQFRMGGCKGVLVTWPDVKGMEVHIRKSQEKFVAEFNGLEVIRCSQFSTATLNRQIIAVLSSLGVPDQVFVDMMEQQLSDFNAAMEDKQKATAILRTFIDENHMTPIIAEMLAYGFMESQEPFVRTLLQLWRSWSIKTLKEKARLNVEKSAFVLGCVDETGTLKGHMKVIEDWKDVPNEKLPQIFLQIPDDVNGGYKVITGTCVVGRNPSLHPGDIRVVEAVDVPALRHLRDVVVFPLTGDRDVPSMCSGGDLDGDDFFVIWDPLLIPKERSHPPMINEPVVGKELATEPTVNNLITFFVLYMKYNNLPLIAHAHLATADAEMEGVKSPKCLELASLHSMAVDYVKTGVAAEFPRRLDPKTWPHFMEKNRHTYHSATALGKLYDMAKRETFDMKENYQLPFDNRILKHTKCRALTDETLTKARRIKSQYDTAMRRVMCQLEIATEFEVWTAFVMSKPRVGSDYKLQDNVGRESSALKQHFKDQCKKEAGGDLLSFVSAMYRVTYEEVRIAHFEAKQPHVRPDGSLGTRKVTPKTMPLVSFPWLFWDKLGELARTGAILQRRLDDGSEDMDLLSDVPLVSQRRRGRHNASGSRDFMDEHGDPLSYTRTSDGKVIHYGQILNLFSHDDEDGDERNDARNRNSSSEESTPGSNSTKSASNLSPVAEEVNDNRFSLSGFTMENYQTRRERLSVSYEDLTTEPVTPQKQLEGAILKERIEQISYDEASARLNKVHGQLETQQGKRNGKGEEKELKNALANAVDNLRQVTTQIWEAHRDVSELGYFGNPLRTIEQGASYATLLVDMFKIKEAKLKRDPTLRRVSEEWYDGAKEKPISSDGPTQTTKDTWCHILGIFCNYKDITAGHIVPHHFTTAERSVQYLFGEQHKELSTPTNVLLLSNQLEQWFDKYQFVIVPCERTAWPILRWQVEVISTDIHHQKVNTPEDSNLVLSGLNLHQRELTFRNQNRPRARFMFFRFMFALITMRQRERPGWKHFWARYATIHPFASPGRYITKGYLLSIAADQQLMTPPQLITWVKELCEPDSPPRALLSREAIIEIEKRVNAIEEIVERDLKKNKDPFIGN